MAGNSHRHTKLVNYRQKPIRRRRTGSPFWLLIPICAVLAFVIALILGNTLGNIAESSMPGEASSSQPVTKLPEQNTHGPIQINACHVSLEGITDNTASEVRKQISSDASAVSMTLFSPSGYPYYHSEVTSSFNKYCGELTLKNVFKPVIEKELYSSVLFPSSALLNDDPSKSAVLNAYEASLASELYLAGADEIIIVYNGFGSNKTFIDGESSLNVIADYVSEMRRQADGLRIGIVLSVADLENEENTVIIEKICDTVDFCALDLTHFSSIENITETVNALSIDILRHEMRVLLSESGKTDEYLSAVDELLDKFGMNNRQFVK